MVEVGKWVNPPTEKENKMAAMRSFEERLGEQVKATGYELHINVMTGKLEGITGFGTTCQVNEWCQELMQNPCLICSRCYADVTTRRYDTLEQWLEHNYELLTSRILDPEEFPIIPTLYGRIEPFGDLAKGEKGVIQSINYIQFCKRNSHARIGWWTKHPQQIEEAIRRGYDKPENVNIVYSGYKINEDISYEEIHEKYPFVDKVFIVFDKNYVRENGIEINCGGRHCRGCLICYEKNDIHVVHEQLRAGRKPEYTAIS